MPPSGADPPAAASRSTSGVQGRGRPRPQPGWSSVGLLTTASSCNWAVLPRSGTGDSDARVVYRVLSSFETGGTADRTGPLAFRADCHDAMIWLWRSAMDDLKARYSALRKRSSMPRSACQKRAGQEPTFTEYAETDRLRFSAQRGPWKRTSKLQVKTPSRRHPSQ